VSDINALNAVRLRTVNINIDYWQCVRSVKKQEAKLSVG